MATSELLAGFLKEAQGYVDELRGSLEAQPPSSAPETLQTMHRCWHTIAGAAEMLELHSLAALASPGEETLEDLIESGAPLSEDCRASLVQRLKDVQVCLDGLLPTTKQVAAPPPPRPKIALALDQPTDILEIFALEAAEHNQVIAVDLERLKKDPGDVDTIGELRRVIHTLKGAAATVGLAEMARVAHQTEDLLDQWLDSQEIPGSEGLVLLADAAEALASPFESDAEQDSSTLLSAISERLVATLGTKSESAQPAKAAEIVRPREAKDLRAVVDSVLRIPQTNIDQLVNRVGEVVINRAAIEGNVQTMDTLLSDLEYSTKRLRRVADGLDLEVRNVSASVPSAGEVGFDPLEMEQYSLLYQYTRELEEVSADTGNIHNQLRLVTDDLDSAVSRERRLTTELQDGLMATRLIPFAEIEIRLRRIVHKTAQDLGKNVELRLIGGDTRVDKAVLLTLSDPLMHLLRNAVDHGIEPPAVRARLDKPPVGLISLTVSRERGRVVLCLADDGAGIDLEHVRKHAVEVGLVKRDDRRTQEELLSLLFEERFSLAKSVSETSGRGVGLNVVQHAVRQLQGTVSVEARPGVGAMFTISVPITLAITHALLVRSAGQTYAIPLEQIARVVRLEPEMQQALHNQKVLRDNGRALGAYTLEAFGSRKPSSPVGQPAGYGLVVEQGGQGSVMLVDELVGTHEIVVKSLGSHLRRVHGVSGATITGDGSVVLILDLVEIIGGRKQVTAGEAISSPRPARTKSRSALVVDDSLSVRRVVSMFLEREGWTAIPAKDGVEALEKLSTSCADVALVDIEMPRMNGYELLSAIRSDPNLHNLPVIFLTSRSAEKHRDRAALLGVNGYLVKPYQEAHLLAELERVIRENEQQPHASISAVPSR